MMMEAEERIQTQPDADLVPKGRSLHEIPEFQEYPRIIAWYRRAPHLETVLARCFVSPTGLGKPRTVRVSTAARTMVGRWLGVCVMILLFCFLFSGCSVPSMLVS